jgi:integrase
MERMPKLTKTLVERLAPRADRYVIWDDLQPGLGVVVQPSGRRSFIFKYRVGGGRRSLMRKPVIGQYGPVTVDQARAVARKWGALVVQGGDPSGERIAHRAADTVAQFCDRWLEDHARPHKKPKSVAQDEWLMERVIKPELGTRKMQDVTTAEVVRLVAKLRDRPTVGNRTRALLHTMFKHAALWGIRSLDQVNPVQNVQRYPERRRRRFLSFEELKRLGDTLAAVEHDASEPWQAVAAIRLLLLTGCRKSEILTAEWAWLDREQALLALPDSKTGAKVVYLSAPAMALLASLPSTPRPAGHNGGPALAEARHVLPSARREDQPFDGLWHCWTRIRTAAGLADVRLHDLRHTFGSHGVNLGMGLPLIGGLLGHTQPETTQRYAHLAAAPVREAGERIAAAIAAALAAGTRAQ